jgi:hypothetical protein
MERAIVMRTVIDQHEITYEVWDGDDALGDHGDARCVFQKTVKLMQTEAYRAGGYHVTAVAREQERCAMQLAEAHSAMEREA